MNIIKSVFSRLKYYRLLLQVSVIRTGETHAILPYGTYRCIGTPKG